ncbi:MULTISPECIES: hypothetical protein [Pseudomonas]|jgi:hypothetical protein|uniref:hypothetical protein n=1 Tax=Pseudomonas TaxID=286 RepID=UPI002362F89A|nr:hypothetical protein [Pseudomonas sp. TNT2022 ID642]MDD1003632.1 hypothetical protein [Pseudomonas sp. TNT2022 ID642]
MSLFYNGKLWVTPATMSKVDDSAYQSANLGVGNYAAFIGTSAGGEPNTPLAFSSPAEAKAALISGPLLDAITKAFAPSAETGGPSTVYAVRVNPAVQATLALKDTAGADSILLKSSDYGQWTNQIKTKIESGSVSGLMVTTQYQNGYVTQDNIARPALTVQYTGAQANAAMTVSGTSIVLQAPSGTTVATVDLNVYSTYQQVVDYINTIDGFSAGVVDPNNINAVALNGLDYATAANVKTQYTVTANLQAVIDWFNSGSEGLVTASRAPDAGTMPALLPFTYLAGGSNGVTSTPEWSAAFTTLQSVDAQWICPVSTTPAIWAMADAHVQFMSKFGRMERRAVCGTDLGTSDAAAIAFAKALNSDRTSLVHLGHYGYDVNGNLALFNASYTAAMLTGMFAGVNPGTALSNKSINVSGLERNLRNPTDTDALITGGVLCIESTKNGYKVVQSISTWLVDKKFNKVEQSCGWATDYTARTVREALDVLRGQKNNQVNLGRAATITDTVLKALSVAEPAGPGVLAGDKANPPYMGITVTASGDTLAVAFQCSPVIPINYIPVSISLKIFTGTASA